MVYPAFGVVFAKGIEGFSQLDPAVRRHQGDRNALWWVLSRVLLSPTTSQVSFETGSLSLPSFPPSRSASRITSSHLLLPP